MRPPILVWGIRAPTRAGECVGSWCRDSWRLRSRRQGVAVAQRADLVKLVSFTVSDGDRGLVVGTVQLRPARRLASPTPQMGTFDRRGGEPFLVELRGQPLALAFGHLGPSTELGDLSFEATDRARARASANTAPSVRRPIRLARAGWLCDGAGKLCVSPHAATRWSSSTSRRRVERAAAPCVPGRRVPVRPHPPTCAAGLAASGPLSAVTGGPGGRGLVLSRSPRDRATRLLGCQKGCQRGCPPKIPLATSCQGTAPTTPSRDTGPREPSNAPSSQQPPRDAGNPTMSNHGTRPYTLAGAASRAPAGLCRALVHSSDVWARR